MADPTYTARLAWHGYDLDEDGHEPASAVTYDNSTSGLTATDAQAAIDEVAAAESGAPATADYLVGTAQAGLSAEIVVGTTPGGELGGTWAAPTVDATHSGSSHAAAQAAAEATAATALAGHTGDASDAHDASAVSIADAGGYYAGADVEAALQEIGAGGIGGGSAITVEDEGSALATAATTVNFVGAGVTASGTGATKTVTIPGGGSVSADHVRDAGRWELVMTPGLTDPPEPVWSPDGTDYVYAWVTT
jgi:hypothetical protein